MWVYCTNCRKIWIIASTTPIAKCKACGGMAVALWKGASR